MIDMTALVLTLNHVQVIKLDEVYTEINLILTAGKGSENDKLKRVKNYLQSKRDSNSGKLKKIFAAMTKSDNIREGVESHFYDKLASTTLT